MIGTSALRTLSIAMTTVLIKGSTRVRRTSSVALSDMSATRCASTRDFCVRRRRPNARPGLAVRSVCRIRIEYAVMRSAARTRPKGRSSGSVATFAVCPSVTKVIPVHLRSAQSPRIVPYQGTIFNRVPSLALGERRLHRTGCAAAVRVVQIRRPKHTTVAKNQSARGISCARRRRARLFRPWTAPVVPI